MTSINDDEDETQRCLRALQSALRPFSTTAQHGAVTAAALTLALAARSKDDVCAWLDTLREGVANGTIAASSEGWRIN